MADTVIAPRAPRAIDANVTNELALLLELSAIETDPDQAASLREDINDTLFAVECLPVTKENAVLRARVVAVLHGGDLQEWDDGSPMGLIVRQIVEALI